MTAAAAVPFWQSAGGAAAIGAGASILGGAFGGGGMSRADTSRAYRRQRSHEEFQLDLRNRERTSINKYDLQQKVDAAKAAGLHPLFAMGGQTSGGVGAGSAPAIQGQSDRGDFAKDGLASIAKLFMGQSARQHDLDMIEAENQRSALALARENSGNDEVSGIEVPVNIDKGDAGKYKDIVAIEPDKQRTRSSEDAAVSAASNPAWMEIEIADGIKVQTLWSEEGPAEALDNLPALALTIARNSYLGYKAAYNLMKRKHREYYSSRPGRDRHPNKYRLRTKSRSYSSEPHIPYSRGPHR